MDFATLSLKADTSGLTKAEDALDNVAAAGVNAAVKVDGALDKIDAAFKTTGASAKDAAKGVSAYDAAVAGMGSRIPAANDNIKGMGTQTRLASHHVQNLAFQFQDLGVQIAGGANPLTAFIQQGSQISGIMMQAGMGVGGLVREIGRLVLTAARVVLLNPVFLGLATAAGVASLAFSDFRAEVDKSGELTKFRDGLGLTRAELKKLEAAVGPATVTMGDVFKGLGKTIADALDLGPSWAALKKGFADTGRFLISAVGDVAAGLYAGFVGSFRAVVRVWGDLPEVFGDLGITAANAVIRALVGMANQSIGVVNRIIDQLNDKFGKFGVEIGGHLSNFDVPQLENRYKGAASAAGNVFTSEVRNAFDQAKAGFKATGDTLSANIIEAAKERMKAGADAIIDERQLKDKAASAGKSAGETLGEYITVETGQAITALEKSFKFDDSVMREAAGNLEAVAKSGSDAFRDHMSENLDTFSTTMGEIAELFGGKLGGAINQFASLIRRDLPSVASSIGSMFNKISAGLGDKLGALGSAAGFGASVGSIIGGSGRGAKGAQIGGAIGGAAGSMFGPAGQLIGSVLGSLVGSLFKGKNDFADVRLNGTGTGTLYNQRGQDSAKIGSALGGEFGQQLAGIAQALGGTVRGGQQFGSIGFSGEQFYFNAQGGDFKGAGVQKFGSAEEAVAAAIRNAVSKGAFDGLSESSKVILERVGSLGTEEILAVLNQIATARNVLADAYNREASAIGATIEKFQAMTANLQSFRDTLAEQLMTAEEIYTAARTKFEEISKGAIAGNEEAIGQLVGVSQNYLASAKQFLTPEEYNREIENVMKAVDLAIVQSKSLEAFAQEQLDALNKSVEGLITLDNSVTSVAEAIKALQDVMAGVASRPINVTVTGGGGTAGDDGIPRFAMGGFHTGGLAMVGEQGPELVNMGPSRIWNAGQTASMLRAANDDATHAELVRLNEYVRELVKINHKQERDLKELIIQGEAA